MYEPTSVFHFHSHNKDKMKHKLSYREWLKLEILLILQSSFLFTLMQEEDMAIFFSAVLNVVCDVRKFRDMLMNNLLPYIA